MPNVLFVSLCLLLVEEYSTSHFFPPFHVLGVSLLQEKKDYSVFNLSIPLLLPLIYAFGITSLPHYIAAAALFAYSVAAATSSVIASIRGRRSSSFGEFNLIC
nr:hypothetical protein Iba_chr10cCG3450 [Ipomoea batatas]